MPRITPSDDATCFDPPPCYATDAEIALAARLRRQLEEQYFGSSATAFAVPEPTAIVH